MKKYILPLILILFLTFVLIGDCDWLSGYDQRIKLTIDNTKIDGALSDFPVTIFFTSTQGEEIFTEFDADSDYMKCAFTASDGTTQLYAEKELFDDSEQKAIYHVKVTSVASGADTDIYYYYDNDHADNTTYIGAINTAAGAAVWDANFKSVYHLNTASNAQLIDSTSNDKDSTSNTLDTIVGKVGLGMDADGAEYAVLGNIIAIGAESFVIELCFKTSNTDETFRRIFSSYVGNGAFIAFGVTDAQKLVIHTRDSTSTLITQTTSGDVNDGNWHYACVRRDDTGNVVKVYLDDTEYDSDEDTRTGNFTNDLNTYSFGATYGDPYYQFFTGQLDEIRTSAGTARTASWQKAIYNSLYDTLLTYGAEETGGVTANAIFFGMNF